MTNHPLWGPAGMLLVLLLPVLCSCASDGNLGAPSSFASETPKDVFVAYSSAVTSRRYADVRACLSPALHATVTRVLTKKKLFDQKAATLAATMQSKFGNQMRDDLQTGAIDPVESIWRRALYVREPVDFASATYARHGRHVVASAGDRPFGLMAFESGSRWHLEPRNPAAWAEDLKMLERLLESTSQFLDRTNRDILAGKIGESELRQLLRKPQL